MNNRLWEYLMEGQWDNALATANDSAERDVAFNTYIGETAIITRGLGSCILAGNEAILKLDKTTQEPLYSIGFHKSRGKKQSYREKVKLYNHRLILTINKSHAKGLP